MRKIGPETAERQSGGVRAGLARIRRASRGNGIILIKQKSKCRVLASARRQWGDDPILRRSAACITDQKKPLIFSAWPADRNPPQIAAAKWLKNRRGNENI